MRKLCLFVLATAMIISGLATAQTTGDYRSIQNGNWGTIATWETYNGSSWVPASTVPPIIPPYANVTIQSGDTIIIETSPKRTANLVVEPEALLYTNQSGSNRYVRLFGDFTNDGTFGGPTDALGIMCSTDVYISGTGVIDIIRLQAAAANITLDIACPITLHYVGAGLYGMADNITYNIDAPNGQVTCGPSTYVGITTSSYGPSNYNATFNIDGGGLVLQPGNNFNISVRSGKASQLNVYSTLVLGDTLFADNDTTTGSETVIVNGAITYTSTDTMKFDHLYTNNSSGLSFGFPVRVNRILSIGWGDYDNSSGLTLADGTTIIRYYGALAYAPTLEGGVNLRYGENPGGLPLYTALEVPSDTANHIYDVYFNNSYGVFLNSTIAAYGDVTLQNGVVNANGNVLGCFNQPTRNTGYVVNGMLGIMIPAGDNTIAYYVGTDNGYSPATIDFKNVTTPNGVGVTCFEETHSEVNYSTETMQRYWEIGMNPSAPVVFDSCSIEFIYWPGDFNDDFTEMDDESTMVVGQYDGGAETWAFPEISLRAIGENNDGGSIKIANVTGFSDFTMGKNQNSIAADETPPYIVSTYPADGDSNIALDQALMIVYSEPMDTTSINGYSVPAINLNLSWNSSGDTLTLTPDTLYISDTTYTVYNTDGTDLAGNPIEGLPVSFSFTTVVGDTVKPYVLFTSPADGDSNVALDEPIVLAFSEPMNPASINGYTSPDAGSMTLTWNAAFDTLTATPETPYNYNTTYSLIVTAGTDVAGNDLSLLPDTVVSFTTVSIGDTVRPYITGTNPADGATDVPLDEIVYIAFSEPINPSSFNGYSTPVFSFTPSWSSAFDTLFLTPDVNYDLNTAYALFCTSGTDMSGNTLVGLPVSFGFTTIPTGVEGKPETQVYTLQLSPVAPNPMTTGRTTFQFSLPTSAYAKLEVFNVLGQKVSTLVDGNLGAGNHTVNWNGTDKNGKKLTSGVYIYQLKVPGKTLTKRLTIIR